MSSGVLGSLLGFDSNAANLSEKNDYLPAFYLI